MKRRAFLAGLVGVAATAAVAAPEIAAPRAKPMPRPKCARCKDRGEIPVELPPVQGVHVRADSGYIPEPLARYELQPCPECS